MDQGLEFWGFWYRGKKGLRFRDSGYKGSGLFGGMFEMLYGLSTCLGLTTYALGCSTSLGQSLSLGGLGWFKV